jgi:hypothetical protein
LSGDGSLSIECGGATYAVRSSFSSPGGGTMWLGPPGGQPGDRALALRDATRTRQGYRFTAATGDWKLSREVALLPGRIAVSDTLTSTAGELIGVRFAHRLSSAQADGFRLGGTVKPVPCQMAAPERPLVQLAAGRGSVGMVARDDVFRNQSVLFADTHGVGLRDDHFGLAPGASCTLRWEVYPLASAGHFELVNAIRHAWGSDRATIPGLFAFTYPQHRWAATNRTLAESSVEELRAWLRTTGIHTLCIVLNADPDAPGHEEAAPQFRKPWLSIEAFGSDLLSAKVSREYWRPVVARLRQAQPGVKIVPYFHMAANPIDPAFTDARVLSEDGSPKTFRNYAPVTRGYYYATPTNGFGRLIRRAFQTLLVDPLFDGIYWDEFSFGNLPVYMPGVPDWDGHSVAIDPRTTRVLRKVTNLALVTRAVRESLCDDLVRLHKPLWTNWQPTTEHDAALHVPHFLEYVRGDEAARGHLASPLGCGGHESRSQADVIREVREFLDLGLLYVHIDTGAYVETSESVLKHCYPITPLELHDGYILGRERIVTARSGSFGFGDSSPLTAVVFGPDGKQRPARAAAVAAAGHTFCRLQLEQGSIGIVTRRP